MDRNKHAFRPGDVVELAVVRKSDLGVFLDAGTGNTSDDILLHNAQQTEPVAVGQTVKVYLYTDPKGRLTASMRLPQMREGQVARVEVINTTRDGTFVNIGAERGVFMPHAGRRGLPRRGEKVWVKLYRDKSGRPAVTMEVEDELRQASRPAEGVKVGDMVTGSVYNYNEQGAFLFTKDRFIAFLHNDEMTERPRVGAELDTRVTYIREDGRINVSMRPAKENAMDEDTAKILQVLRSRGGQMPYSDNSPPEIIKEKFNISKAAFKRAMGRLLKARLIEQKEGWTYLINNEGGE
ncbi:S1 RNA-binding domain containing protein [uncultured Sporomusa sp.]|uniref:S1 RNA-binding domain containing protein n=1 Tax=uncultured Sporomusa sp. TaxID=307249 RepID=A0A212LSU6_9FIRM|nr:S1-like domain-containing RNA-binding protein [uncultured Sporomusa sp.]SCM80684.1 S1 RNA-binding domain containing protein [uncultured Sporomusa sp.]